MEVEVWWGVSYPFVQLFPSAPLWIITAYPLVLCRTNTQIRCSRTTPYCPALGVIRVKGPLGRMRSGPGARLFLCPYALMSKPVGTRTSVAAITLHPLTLLNKVY